MAQRRELLGYADPMVAQPGTTVQIMVTTEAERYDAEIVRLIHGDTNPAGPGVAKSVGHPDLCVKLKGECAEGLTGR